MSSWIGSGARGVQLRPRTRREGFRRDLLILVAGAAVLGVVIALLVWLVLPPRASSGTPSVSGQAAGNAVDVPVDHVSSKLPDGRTALGSFTVRMNPTSTPNQLKELAAKGPSTEDASASTPVVARGSSEARLRDTITTAMAGLSYQQSAGEEGRERLRQSVRDAVNTAFPGQPVEQVYIREYIVQ